MALQDLWERRRDSLRFDPEFSLESGSVLDRIDSDVAELLFSPAAQELAYSPLEVEFLLEEAVGLLESCLELRRGAQEIEVAITQTYLEHELRAQELKIAHAQLRAGILRAQLTPDIVAEEQIREFEEREEERLETQQAYFEILRSKAATPGDGLNLKERYSALKALFDQDLVKAYRRLVALQTGLSRVYGLQPAALPDPRDFRAGFLDQLTRWLRTHRTKLQQLLLTDYDYTMVVSLRHQCDKADGSGRFDADFPAACNARTLRFQVPKRLFDGQERPRLRGVGAQVVWAREVRGDRFVVEIDVPREPGVSPATIYLGDVAALQETAIERVHTARKIFNRSPIGEWEVRVREKSQRDEKFDFHQSADVGNVVDFQLILRVAVLD